MQAILLITDQLDPRHRVSPRGLLSAATTTTTIDNNASLRMKSNSRGGDFPFQTTSPICVARRLYKSVWLSFRSKALSCRMSIRCRCCRTSYVVLAFNYTAYYRNGYRYHSGREVIDFFRSHDDRHHHQQSAVLRVGKFRF